MNRDNINRVKSIDKLYYKQSGFTSERNNRRVKKNEVDRFEKCKVDDKIWFSSLTLDNQYNILLRYSLFIKNDSNKSLDSFWIQMKVDYPPNISIIRNDRIDMILS